MQIIGDNRCPSQIHNFNRISTRDVKKKWKSVKLDVTSAQGWKKIVSFPQSWPIFPQFAMHFYVQKSKISLHIKNFPPNTNISPNLFTILSFFPCHTSAKVRKMV